MIIKTFFSHEAISIGKMDAKIWLFIRGNISLSFSTIIKGVAFSLHSLSLRYNFILNFFIIPYIILFITFLISYFLFISVFFLNSCEFLLPIIFKGMFSIEYSTTNKFFKIFLFEFNNHWFSINILILTEYIVRKN